MDEELAASMGEEGRGGWAGRKGGAGHGGALL